MKKTLLSIIALTTLIFSSTAQDVNIPDANFKAYLVGNSNINTNSDTEIQVSEATAFTGTIDCPSLNINELIGLEVFNNITGLKCQNNNLTILDISQNTSLDTVWCNGNNISLLDVSLNTSLINLICSDNNLSVLDISQNLALANLRSSGNNLTSLDVSQNPNLIQIWIEYNNLASLDVTNNPLLEILNIGGNNLNALDVSQNPNLTFLWCWGNDLTVLNMKNLSTSLLTTFDAVSNPNLTCIDVDNVATATSTWTNIDAGVSYSLNCQVDLVTSIGVQGQGGSATISTQGGTLQMEAHVLPTYADDDTYTWSVTNGTGSASINTAGLLTAATNGTVTVTATTNDASGVTGSTVITISNQSSVGINEKTNISSLSIYPNPVNSQLTINSNAKIETIEIIDIMGKTIKTITSSSNTIDVSHLTRGVYFLQMQTAKGLVSTKFIKE